MSMPFFNNDLHTKYYLKHTYYVYYTLPDQGKLLGINSLHICILVIIVKLICL